MTQSKNSRAAPASAAVKTVGTAGSAANNGYVFPKFNAAQSPVPVRRYNLPRDFVFGASTSAYQIEGAVDQEKYGRGPSIWEEYFEKRPHLDNGMVACDHYNRMKEDVAMIKAMGHKVYRFSVSWPRIMPQGIGRINEQGLQFYSDLVDELRAQGIEPYLTLYHWDLPLAMQKLGGWTSRAVAEHFADFAEVVVKRLGDRVQKWCTFNEPEVIVAGYIGDGLAPGFSDSKLRVHAAHGIMIAHGLAVKRIRALNPDLDVGIVVNLVPVEPATKAATRAARKMWQRNYAIYLDGILKGRYSDTVLEEAAETGVIITAEDMELIAQPIDYLGINWYLRLVVNSRGRVLKVPAAEETLMGWEICPAALTRMLLSMNKEYKLPPVYITENGAALHDEVSTDSGSAVHDNRRMLYIHEHLSAIELAIAGGVDMRGYFAWSLMDNLEWSLGYSKTFGMVHVDRQTLVRTVKDSGLWYRAMIKANRR